MWLASVIFLVLSILLFARIYLGWYFNPVDGAVTSLAAIACAVISSGLEIIRMFL